MAVFAFPTVIGPAGLLEWTFKSKKAYSLAMDEASAFIRILQEILSAQLGRPVLFDDRLIGMKSEDELEEFNDMRLPVGNIDGIQWFKDSINQWLEEKEVNGKGFDQTSISNYSHIIEHDPVSGIFLPFDFSHPFNHSFRGDIVSISSLIQAQKELYLWKDLILPRHHSKTPELAKVSRDYANNFLEVIDYSINKGVAVEIL